MHTFTPYMLMKDNFGAEFLICDKLRANVQSLSGSNPAQNKKEPLLRLFFIWCERRDLASAAAVPCMLMARRPSQATVPGSPLFAENSPPDCFFTLRPSRVQAPLKIKKSRCCDSSYLVRETGLEPVRDYHTPLKRARLPIPPLSHSIVVPSRNVCYYSRTRAKCQELFLKFLPVFSFASLLQ